MLNYLIINIGIVGNLVIWMDGNIVWDIVWGLKIGMIVIVLVNWVMCVKNKGN